MTNQPTQQWGSRLGVILAVAGSAVGLGNFLRFPGQAAANGGGAFMIPYFCALILLGIPIGWAEWAMGRFGGRKGFHSAPAILGIWCKGAAGRYLGVFGVLIPLGVYFYYVIIESWCLYYFLSYCGGGLGIPDAGSVAEQVTSSKAFYASAKGESAHGALFASRVHPVVWAFVITAAANLWFVYRGLSKGIEAVCKYAMPVMAILGIIVLVRVLTLGTPDAAAPDQSVLGGLGFMWNPKWEALGEFDTWLAAAGQIFFSLSVGFGVIINYASYMKKKDDVVLSGLTASATNEFFEVVLGGLITITAAVVFLGITAVQGSKGSFDLGFNTLPVVFARMPGGDFFGAAFFLILFLAAITSSLSMLQPTKAFFEESLGIDKKKSTLLVTAWGLGGNAVVLYFTANTTVLNTIDFWVGTFFILVVAAVQIIAFGWIFGLERGIAEAHEGARLRIPVFFQVVIKYVCPLYLAVVLVGFCVQNLGGEIRGLIDNRDAQIAWAVILLTIGGLVAITAIGARRWRAQGLDLDGRLPAKD
ncbi:MAG: sodium-dependent transporter [Planctomycetota bacterium]